MRSVTTLSPRKVNPPLEAPLPSKFETRATCLQTILHERFGGDVLALSRAAEITDTDMTGYLKGETLLSGYHARAIERRLGLVFQSLDVLPVAEVRKKQLRSYIDRKFNGSQRALCIKHGLVESTVSQILNGALAFSDDRARLLEGKCGMEYGVLDDPSIDVSSRLVKPSLASLRRELADLERREVALKADLARVTTRMSALRHELLNDPEAKFDAAIVNRSRRSTA
jgi:hypothetical protein